MSKDREKNKQNYNSDPKVKNLSEGKRSLDGGKYKGHTASAPPLRPKSSKKEK